MEEPSVGVLAHLLSLSRPRIVHMLDQPLPTIEIARRLAVTPSAASQHLKILRANGLVACARDRRQVLYHRTPVGDQLSAASSDR